MPDESPKVLVIGGGVAGSSCALSLARAGVRVDLVEKATFPRYKVCGCCIGPAGLAMLDQLDLRGNVESKSRQTSRWVGSFDSRKVELQIPPGIAVAREVLDPLILDAAVSAGAKVQMGVSAKIVSSDHSAVTVQFSNQSSSLTQYACVVVAAGLNAPGLNAFLQWRETPRGPFGAACTIDGAVSCNVAPGTIYMACDREGYVGLVRLSETVIDVAAALQPGNRSGDTPLQRMQRILTRSGFDFPLLQPTSLVLTTAMLRRTRAAGNKRLLAIGDAAGYVEPFTGEGMTWAMQSGIAAADLIASTGPGDTLDDSLGEQWRFRVDQLLGHKKRVCRLVTTGCHNPLVRATAGIALSRFPKPVVSWLASPLLKTINSTNPFPTDRTSSKMPTSE